MHRETVTIRTKGRGSVSLNEDMRKIVARSSIREGFCHLFLCHTSASLIFCENTDSAVLSDLETFAGSLVKDGERLYRHDSEGPDDMAAHIRTVYTHTDLTIPIDRGRLFFGTWQGVYLWEHRTTGRSRHILVTCYGPR
ncbi:MAG: secondary thiamine-phosphate synthase enzyme YjbQ [Simkaniaceae bacterium]|nr:secondary thiamine-phosphate synthase enzyme YjbQ [Simkaniaceae bacterium]